MKEAKERDMTDNSSKYLIYGKNGWIGGKLIALLEGQGKTVVLGDARLQNRETLEKEILAVKPTNILCAAGITGRPNIDWCESHQQETLRTNVIGILNLADLCDQHNIHHTLYATGCIFEYDDNHTIENDVGFTEEDSANFFGSFYSKTKAYMEEMLKSYKTTLTLRVRMPISDDLNPRNFVSKIVKYDRVVNIPNSMTVLHDLLPVSLEMAYRKLTGIYNFTNPGAISHNEVLSLYKKYVDPDYTWKNFTIEEQDKILAAKRSNNLLDTTKITSALPDLQILDIHSSCELVFQRMRQNLEAEENWPNNLPRRMVQPED